MGAAKRQKITDIRESLLEQLRSSGRDTPYYIDMVDAYLDLWREREAFRKDISKRGYLSARRTSMETHGTKSIPRWRRGRVLL